MQRYVDFFNYKDDSERVVGWQLIYLNGSNSLINNLISNVQIVIWFFRATMSALCFPN